MNANTNVSRASQTVGLARERDRLSLKGTLRIVLISNSFHVAKK
jgi:hypothetical protein